MYRVVVAFIAQRRTVASSITSTADTLRIPRDDNYACRDGSRAHPRGRRRPRGACDPPLRLPAARPGRGARGRPAGGPRGAALRRAADGAARPPRPCLVEGRRGAARGAVPPGLGPHPERGAGRPAAASRPRAVLNVLVTGGSRGIGRAIALRFARNGAR